MATETTTDTTETDIPVVPVMEVIETDDDSAPPTPTTGGFTPVPAPTESETEENPNKAIYDALPEHGKWFANVIIKHGAGSQQDVQSMHKIYEDLFLGIQTMCSINPDDDTRADAVQAMNDFRAYVDSGDGGELIKDENYRYRGSFGRSKLTNAQEAAVTGVLNWFTKSPSSADDVTASGVWNDAALATLTMLVKPVVMEE